MTYNVFGGTLSLTQSINLKERFRLSKVKVKIWSMLCDNLETMRDRMYVLFTSVNWHTSFQLVLKSVTLNAAERRNDRRRALSLP